MTRADFYGGLLLSAFFGAALWEGWTFQYGDRVLARAGVRPGLAERDRLVRVAADRCARAVGRCAAAEHSDEKARACAGEVGRRARGR